jgi:hypothetical protein
MKTNIVEHINKKVSSQEMLQEVIQQGQDENHFREIFNIPKKIKDKDIVSWLVENQP